MVVFFLDFFYKPQVKPDDAKAVHYIDNIRAWKAKLPPYDRYFRRFNRRRSREVVHLSYKRLEIRDDNKAWYSQKTMPQIKRIVKLFLDMAEPELVHPKLNEFREG